MEDLGDAKYCLGMLIERDRDNKKLFMSQEAIWLRHLLKDLLVDVSKPTIIHEDNQGAICLTKNTKAHSRAKHIDIKYHFIRENVQNKEIELKYCPTDKIVADILTKALPRQRFKDLRSLMGIKKNEH